MTTDHMPEGASMAVATRDFTGARYGLGFGLFTQPELQGSSVSSTAYWWGGAANTGFWVDPQERLVGVLMTQRFPGDQPFAQIFQQLVYQAIEY